MTSRYRLGMYHFNKMQEALRRRRRAYCLVVLDGMTCKEAGAVLGVSSERARQMSFSYAYRHLNLRSELANRRPRHCQPLAWLRRREAEQSGNMAGKGEQ